MCVYGFATSVIDFIVLSNLLFPESPTSNIILFLTSSKGIVFMHLFSFFLPGFSIFVSLLFSCHCSGCNFTSYSLWGLILYFKGSSVCWKKRETLTRRSFFFPSIFNLPTHAPPVPKAVMFRSSFLAMLAMRNWEQRKPWGGCWKRNWESWDLLTAKGNGSAKLVILKRSELTLANERQTDPALITVPWVMASRMNAYNGNGMDLWQQGQKRGRKKEGRWMYVPAVAFEVS